MLVHIGCLSHLIIVLCVLSATGPLAAPAEREGHAQPGAGGGGELPEDTARALHLQGVTGD